MKKLSVIVLAMLMAVGVSGVASAAPELTVGLDFYGGDTAYTQGNIDTNIDLLVGQNVMVDFVYLIGDEDVPGIGLWKAGFNLDFNPATLGASNYQEYGDVWAGWKSYEGNGSGITAGNVKFRGQEQSFLNPDEGRIIGFELTCLEVGVDDILFEDWGTGSDWAIDMVHGGTIIDGYIDFGNTLVTVKNNVPIPGAVWLLGSGLLGLVALGRRKMKS